MRPGAMHTLSLCFGYIGTIMKGLGLEKHFQAAYKSISNMLNEKNWSHAVRGFHMVSSGLVLKVMFDDLHPDATTKFEEAMTSTL